MCVLPAADSTSSALRRYDHGRQRVERATSLVPAPKQTDINANRRATSKPIEHYVHQHAAGQEPSNEQEVKNSSRHASAIQRR